MEFDRFPVMAFPGFNPATQVPQFVIYFSLLQLFTIFETLK